MGRSPGELLSRGWSSSKSTLRGSRSSDARWPSAEQERVARKGFAGGSVSEASGRGAGGRRPLANLLSNLRKYRDEGVDVMEDASGKRLVFYCKLCNAWAHDDNILSDHLRGKRHQAKKEKNEGGPSGAGTSAAPGYPVTNRGVAMTSSFPSAAPSSMSVVEGGVGRETGGELEGEAEGLELDEDRGVSSANVTIAPPPLAFHSDGGKKKKRIDGGLHGKVPAGMEGDWQWYWTMAKEEDEEAARRDGDGGNRLDAKKKTRKASSTSRAGQRVKGGKKSGSKAGRAKKETEGVSGGIALIGFQGEGGERLPSGFDILEFKYDPLVGRGGGEGQGGKMEGGKEERAQEQGQEQSQGLGLGLGLGLGQQQQGVARGGVNGPDREPVAEDSLEEAMGGVEAMEALPGGMTDRPPDSAATEEEAECQVVEPPNRDINSGRSPGKDGGKGSGRGGGRRRRGERQVARSCFLCRKYFKEGCAVAALVNREQRQVACSSRNRKGLFHIFHTPCLRDWVLFCEAKAVSNPPPTPLTPPSGDPGGDGEDGGMEDTKTTGQGGGESGGAMMRHGAGGNVVLCPFCPECQGTGVRAGEEELERPKYPLAQVYKWMLDMSLSREERNVENRWHVSVGGLDSSIPLVGVGCDEKTTIPEGAELKKTELAVRGLGDSEQ